MKRVCILTTVLIVFVAGCDSGPRLLPVFGAVSFEDKPIEKGTIEFVPVDGTSGPSFGGSIKDGRYEVAAAHGAREGGAYQVRITALKKTGKTMSNILQAGGPPLELEDNFIPSKYNRNSKMKLVVTPDMAYNAINFKL